MPAGVARVPLLRGRLGDFLLATDLDAGRAAGTLRLLYVVAFGAQVVVALVVGVTVRSLTRLNAPATSLLGWILVVLAVLQVALGIVVGGMAGRHPSRSGALSGTITLAVVLATPAWFAALAFATAQGSMPLLGLWACLAASYAVGLLLVTRLAVRGAAAAPESAESTGRAGRGSAANGDAAGDHVTRGS